MEVDVMTNDNDAFVSQRHSSPAAATLTPEAETFYRTLSSADYPRRLVETIPRIANQIAVLHGNKPLLTKYFESLLVDQRGGRRGFDFAILVEIQNLFDILVGIPSGLSNTNTLLQSQRKR